jgi:hypothetical protein
MILLAAAVMRASSEKKQVEADREHVLFHRRGREAALRRRPQEDTSRKAQLTKPFVADNVRAQWVLYHLFHECRSRRVKIMACGNPSTR